MKKARIAIILVLLCIAGGAVWWYLRTPAPQVSATDIAASGFIEAKNISVSTEIGGRIVFVGAAEGDSVKAGDPMVRLDDSLLKAQQRQAEAAVGIAQASLSQAQATRDGASKVLQNALDVQRNPLELDARIVAAQGQLDVAELSLKLADYRLDQWNRAAAQLQRDVARKNLDNLLAVKADPQAINASVDQARAAYDSAEASLAVVRAQIEQAQAALEPIKVQLTRTAVSSPASGVIASRNAEPGEVAQPGLSILVITQLDEVTLTIYVPESQLGLVKLGQDVRVSTDSYPNEAFSGKVVFISPSAQFTPKNIQLKEERTKTVYAVKVRLPNPQQKLKSGMPADAVIVTQ